MKKIFVLPIIFLILLTSAYAVPPFQESTGVNELVILYPKLEYYELGVNVSVHFHILNSSGYLLPLSDVTCRVHVYNAHDSHILSMYLLDDSNSMDKYLSLGTNVTGVLGKKPFNMWCNSTQGEAGYLAGIVTVTHNGLEPQLANPLILLLPFIFIVFFLFIAFNLSEEHLTMKFLCFGFSIVSFVATANLALQLVIQNNASTGVINTLTTFYKIALLTEYLIFAYVIIYAFYTFMLWLNKKINPK